MCVAATAAVGAKSHKRVKVLRFKVKTNKNKKQKTYEIKINENQRNQPKSWRKSERKKVRALHTKGLNKFTLNFYEKKRNNSYIWLLVSLLKRYPK